jgi:energy-coupling factor transporter ATP-binding protein EcfA2
MPDLEKDDTGTGPYGRAARLYRSAGWLGTLPVGRVPGQKSPPPRDFTGHGKPYPSDADVGAWETGPEAALNIGLRAAPGTIGLDVDDYGSKNGAAHLAELEARFGPLPPTWVSSARPAPSGIRWFRVPEQLDGRPINWPGEAAKFIEIIQPGHRYAVVWPSTNPDAGGAEYRWSFNFEYEGDWPDEMLVPKPGDLAALPEAWVRGLALTYDRTEKSDLADSQMATWWEALRPGGPCPLIHSVCTKAVHDLADVNGARHEAARDALSAIVRAGGEGHRGAREAAAALHEAFRQAVGAERADGGEWNRLMVGAIKIAATDNPSPRQSCSHDAPPAATALVVPEGFTSPGADSVPPPEIIAPGALTLPDEFWRARESLAAIRQAAHSRVRSADVVFYGTLVRLAAMAPHTLRADTGIGTPASLNLFTAIVGPSGSGKSSGLSVARDIIKSDGGLEEAPLGSGEGVAEAYMGEALEGTGVMAKDGSEKQVKVRKQVRHNVLFHTDEGASLNKLIERAGSTVGETLRSAWSGETIGQKNGRAETTRTVPARSYSTGLVIGYQPSTVLPLLADYEAGTPQRFLFCWSEDDTIPTRSVKVLWPGEMPNPFPSEVPTSVPVAGGFVVGPARGYETIVFAEAILDELYDIEHAKNTGTLPLEHPLRDPFRSQHPVLKVKVSSVLALLEGRRNVTPDDWRLAQIVIETSDRVRQHLQALAQAAAGKARAAFLAAEAEAEHFRAHARSAVAEALDLTAERRVAVRVATWLHEDAAPMTLGAMRKRATSADRKFVEAGVEIARQAGWLTAGEDGRWHPGVSRPGVA